MGTLCVRCGPNVKIDSEGCCWTCGNGATGAWLDKATGLGIDGTALVAAQSFRLAEQEREIAELRRLVRQALAEGAFDHHDRTDFDLGGES